MNYLFFVSMNQWSLVIFSFKVVVWKIGVSMLIDKKLSLSIYQIFMFENNSTRIKDYTIDVLMDNKDYTIV